MTCLMIRLPSGRRHVWRTSRSFSRRSIVCPLHLALSVHLCPPASGALGQQPWCSLVAGGQRQGRTLSTDTQESSWAHYVCTAFAAWIDSDTLYTPADKGKGVVATHALYDSLIELGLKFEKFEVNKMIQRFDNDNSGTIDQEEFGQMVQELNKKKYQKVRGDMEKMRTTRRSRDRCPWNQRCQAHGGEEQHSASVGTMVLRYFPLCTPGV